MRTTVATLAVLVLASGCGADGGRNEPEPAVTTAPSTAPPGGHGESHGQAPGKVTTAALRAGERFQTLTMPRAYTPKPPNGGTDDYRCFLVDPKVTERTFLTGSQFMPQNAEIVHHAIFFRVQPEQVTEARQLDAATEGDGWTCFSGTGIGGNSAAGQLRGGGAWLAAWAPGGRESLLSSRTGFLMEPGTQIVMQLHYSLLSTEGERVAGDRSAIRLRLADGDADLDPLISTLLPAPVELPCPPGDTGPLCNREQSVLDVWKRFGEQAAAAVSGLNLLCNEMRPPIADSTQVCDRRVREAGTIQAVAGHMHLLGKSIKVELNPDTPQARTLLDIQTYDFDDQSARILDTPVDVKVGDTYRVTCTHDATLRRKLPELQSLPPRYVVWGEGTSDEMCLGIVTYSKPA